MPESAYATLMYDIVHIYEFNSDAVPAQHKPMLIQIWTIHSFEIVPSDCWLQKSQLECDRL